MEAGREEEAIALLERGLDRHPGSAELHLRLAAQLRQGGDAERAQDHATQAESHLRRSVLDSPEDDQAREALARFLATGERWEEARQLYRQLLRRNPGNAEYRARLGISGARLGETDRGEEMLRAALAADPTLTWAYRELADLLLAGNRATAALATYEQLLVIRPADVAAHTNKGILLQQLERLPESRAAFESALKYRPDDADALYGLAVVSTQLNDIERAIALYRRLLKTRPDHASAHNNLGGLLARRGEALAAMEHFRQAVASAPHRRDMRKNIETLTRQYPGLFGRKGE